MLIFIFSFRNFFCISPVLNIKQVCLLYKKKYHSFVKWCNRNSIDYYSRCVNRNFFDGYSKYKSLALINSSTDIIFLSIFFFSDMVHLFFSFHSTCWVGVMTAQMGQRHHQCVVHHQHHPLPLTIPSTMMYLPRLTIRREVVKMTSPDQSVQ